MNEFLNEINNRQISYDELIELSDKFLRTNSQISPISCTPETRYTKGCFIEGDFMVRILYFDDKPCNIFLILMNRCLYTDIPYYYDVFYSLNGDAFDIIKTTLSIIPKSKYNFISTLDAEQVTGVNIHWVTKRINTKSAKI